MRLLASPRTRCKANGPNPFRSTTSWTMPSMRSTCSWPGMASRLASETWTLASPGARRAEQAEIDQVVKRIKGNPSLYKPFPVVPAVTAWLGKFNSDLLRYPLLILIGASASGKTEYAKSLFQNPLELKVGKSEVFPSKMVEFKRGCHDALILDDARDLEFLVMHQEKVQGKYDSRIEFATTQGRTCFYTKYLFKTPTVVTINFTTKNLGHLQSNDWLNRPQNREVVEWPPAVP